MSKKRNDFKLPDELGWEANDAIRKVIFEWLHEVTTGKPMTSMVMMDVAVAQLSDDVYAAIKKYQKKNETTPAS